MQGSHVSICSNSLIEAFVEAQETELIGEAVLVWYYLEQDYCSTTIWEFCFPLSNRFEMSKRFPSDNDITSSTDKPPIRVEE